MSRNSIINFLLWENKKYIFLIWQTGLIHSHKTIFVCEGVKDIPPSGATRPICGIMGTVRLVAGRFSLIYLFPNPAFIKLHKQCTVSPWRILFLSSGMYLIVITRKRKVGDLFGHTVWKALEFDVISYKKTILHLTDIQVIKVPYRNFQSNADGFNTSEL